MYLTRFNLLLSLVFLSCFTFAQNSFDIQGQVIEKKTKEAISFANISLENTNLGVVSSVNGDFYLQNIPEGKYTLVISSIGYTSFSTPIKVDANTKLSKNTFFLEKEEVLFNPVVVTGTKTFKSKFSSPVIVNVLDSRSIDEVQACSVSEALKFQPGLRVETDCQTCNYTQLRMNGLGGAYSQILINGRPIFSALTGLYGLEQIAANTIDRIETVKGGASALYGSSAIGGTVNIITKIPEKNAYSVNYSYQNINTQSNEHQLNGALSLLNKKKTVGASLFMNYRKRDFYDHNRDNYSELPEIETKSIGSNFIIRPKENQKLEINLSYINEYRLGGEMVDTIAYLTQQSEERTHHVYMGSIDYQINFNQENSSFITYLASQYTKRDHYTGIFPDEPAAIDAHLANPPLGNSKTYTINGGVQFNHRFKKFLTGSNVFTLGYDYQLDDVLDQIPAYNYLIDQQSIIHGLFAQSDWKILPKTTLLSGVRMDKSNFVNALIINPRFSLLYSTNSNSQFRVSWGTGFRAPQAFDSDLHIAFAGGGVSRVTLSDHLKEERSNSLTASYNFNKAKEKFVAGFTLEGFYTSLKDAFYLHPLGEDDFGELFEKRNGDGAKIFGTSLEIRANYNKKIQIQSGLTLQSSRFNTAQKVIEGLEARRNFFRTPNLYGFGILSITPEKNYYFSINTVYTGPMDLAHFAGAPEQQEDVFTRSASFWDLSYKMAYTFDLPKIKSDLELFGGIKNLFNSYQQDFDTGKNRDSNYVYGPATPRTFYIGLTLKSL